MDVKTLTNINSALMDAMAKTYSSEDEYSETVLPLLLSHIEEAQKIKNELSMTTPLKQACNVIEKKINEEVKQLDDSFTPFVKSLVGEDVLYTQASSDPTTYGRLGKIVSSSLRISDGTNGGGKGIYFRVKLYRKNNKGKYTNNFMDRDIYCPYHHVVFVNDGTEKGRAEYAKVLLKIQ